MIKKSIIFIISITFSFQTFAWNDSKEGSNKKGVETVAANCTPAVSRAELDINNVKTTLSTGGDMWFNISAAYEVPKGSGKHSIYAGSLWLGGKDVSGQLKVAAMVYRGSGNDFWAGPLSTLTAEIDPATCTEYDKQFISTRLEVAEFAAWYECKTNPDCDEEFEFSGYTVPRIIYDWPAHGRNYDPYNEDFYLAPFYDRNGDGFYNPEDGDYPGYDLNGEVDCSDRKLNIYGDLNLWWVFNDKGNVHTSTGSSAIGMEIRAQGFAFSTNDEVNNMTFYNFELINRSTFTLTETYFGVFADTDIGGYQDDYVGCDVQRGLGYCYNGDNYDEPYAGAQGYLDNPPAVGIDFFEGPYQDSDGIDNAVGIGFNEALNGIGYGDSIVDNERFGMRRFVYFNRVGPNWFTDPTNGVEYYNYLRSYWKDNTKMTYGDDGHLGTIECDFMFPGSSDPLGWGTGGLVQEPWTEVTAGNSPSDRRFVQSAGPFTLTPGAVNDITVGVVWAQSFSGSNTASVDLLLLADEKTQAMFDNCFRVLSGPDSPELVIREMNKELIIYIQNIKASNNYQEAYAERNAFIAAPDSIDTNNDGVFDKRLTEEEKIEYQTYRFEGYKIFQIKDNTVDASSLNDPDRARLIFQCDVRNDVGRIINYVFDKDLQVTIPVEMVNGNNQGISHSFRVTEDQFASGDKAVVNHKTYYFMAVAYAYNNFKEFSYTDPTTQNTPYLESRKAATGGIRPFSGIPHKTEVKNNGTVLQSNYGDQLEITRIEGKGNGGNFLKLKQSSVDEIMSGKPWFAKDLEYEKGFGPVNVKIIDPLNVAEGKYTIQFVDTLTWKNLSDASWKLFRNDISNSDTVYSDKIIRIGYDQLLLDYGISINIEQTVNPGLGSVLNGFIGAELTFSDPSKPWLTGVSDAEGASPFNWIRSGISNDPDFPELNDWIGLDNGQVYENVLQGTWAPFRLTSQENYGPMPRFSSGQAINIALGSDISKIESVDVIFTKDTSKWTRCPVLEAHYDTSNTIGRARKGRLRNSLSVDKMGNPADTTGGKGASTSPGSANYISPMGMGWFPGYAINIETGERLNMAFSENSWLKAENGADMLWNPTSNLTEGPWEDLRGGGMHYVYVFRNNIVNEHTFSNANNPTMYNKPGFRMPAYDAGAFAQSKLAQSKSSFVFMDTAVAQVYNACIWVGFPLLAENQELLETDATVSLRVRRAYDLYGTQPAISKGDLLAEGTVYLVQAGPVIYRDTTYVRGDKFKAREEYTFTTPAGSFDTLNVLIPTENQGLPMYNFSTEGMGPRTNVQEVAESMLDEIRVVPNPYYSFSEYESDKLDTRVKVINLPEKCTVTIYSINGTLIRQFSKVDPAITSIDWDLNNSARIPVASGVYIFHINAPDIGEKVVKWFGSVRTPDLDAF
jgi:hypothetical protein